MNRFDIYHRHCVQLMQTMDRISVNGLPLDKGEVESFTVRMEALSRERFDTLQQIVPDELRELSPENGYKHPPKDTTGLTLRSFSVPPAKLSKKERESITDDFLLPDKCVVQRWCRVEPFLPTSTQQIQKLIAHYGAKVGTNRKTKKPTTDAETLKKLIRDCEKSHNPRLNDLGHILKLSKECRQLSKVIGTYARGWKPGADGRIHSTPGLWGAMHRISWRDPNIAATIADKQEDYVAKGFRKCVRASSGRILIECDYRGIEAVLVGYFAGDNDFMRLGKLGIHDYFCYHLLAYRGKLRQADIPSLSLSDAELKSALKVIKKEFPSDRDDAKHCIAEGSLVLTKRGLVPIQNISIDDELWDGIEWVHHQGVIDQGIREVITYEGLTATSDHQVVTEDGQITSLGEAASRLARLEQTGLVRRPLWTRHCRLLETSARERIYQAESEMLSVWESQMDRQGELVLGQNIGMRSLRSSTNERAASSIGMALGGNHRALQSSSESRLSFLRRTWNKVLVQISKALHRMGAQEPSSFDVSRSGDRQNRQRWSLCTGEYQALNTIGANTQHSTYLVADVQRTTNQNARVRQSLHDVMDIPACAEGLDWRRNNRARQGTCSTRDGENMATSGSVARFARVYDILNAGPRRCFTASDRLVLNCVHGINYGETPFLISALYEIPLDEAKAFHKLFFDVFPKVKQWQDRTLMEADQKHKLTNVWGYQMDFWEVRRWNSRKNRGEGGWELGSEAKSALAFRPRDTAAGMLKEVLLSAPIQNLVNRGEVVGTAHDAILTDVPRERMMETAWTLKNAMEVSWPQLGGLMIGVEVKAGESWSDEMSVLDLGTGQPPVVPDVPKSAVCA